MPDSTHVLSNSVAARRHGAYLRLCLMVSLVCLTGCSMMPHAMQPSQLRKLNRGPALGRDTSNFSIPDPQVPHGYRHLELGEDPFQTQ